MLDKGRSHQAIRDEILSFARSDKCPYCNVTTVDSLDHVLPTSVYPEFSVLAQNLVPACTRCNRKKGQACFKASGENLIHPYFVQMPCDPILFARVVVETETVTWKYYLQQNGSVDDESFEQINNLFVLLDLANLYHRSSVDEILDKLGSIDVVYNAHGAAGVQEYLKRDADSVRDNQGENYWKTVILRALAESSAFCDRGYRLLQ